MEYDLKLLKFDLKWNVKISAIAMVSIYKWNETSSIYVPANNRIVTNKWT